MSRFLTLGLLLAFFAWAGNATQLRQTQSGPGAAPGFLGAAQVRVSPHNLAFLDAADMGGNGNSTISAATSACALRDRTIFCPAPSNLEEWKEHATCCLAHCGSGGDVCFDGCLRGDEHGPGCVKFPLDCTGLAMQNQCFDKCQELGPCNACLQTVQPGDTSGCSLKCQKTFDAEIQGDNCPVSR